MPALFDGDWRLERRGVNGVDINVRYDAAADPERPPLLLLHGFPQTHAIWHLVAPRLRRKFTLVMPDLRGYGDSAKPRGAADHSTYAKRTMALDVLELMRAFGHRRFFVCGHDRGGRVGHRLALDHPGAVRALAVLDISPTLTMYERTTMEFAQRYYHWFFLTQPEPLPETLIGGNPGFYLRAKLGGWGSHGTDLFAPAALAEYERCFGEAAAIHAMCEDYRAAATIDLVHDRADGERRLECPVHALWGERGVVHRLFTPLGDWQEKTTPRVSGRPLPAGHYLPEEVPELVASELEQFFLGAV